LFEPSAKRGARAIVLKVRSLLYDFTYGVADLEDDFERETAGFTFKIIP
jgi:hypothetical protein